MKFRLKWRINLQIYINYYQLLSIIARQGKTRQVPKSCNDSLHRVDREIKAIQNNFIPILNLHVRHVGGELWAPAIVGEQHW